MIDFRIEAERVVGTLQIARRDDAVALLIALFEQAETQGKLIGVVQAQQAFSEIMTENRETQADYDEDAVGAFR